METGNGTLIAMTRESAGHVRRNGIKVAGDSGMSRRHGTGIDIAAADEVAIGLGVTS